MPRHREFDPHESLQTAIALFWEKGYYDTSVDEEVMQNCLEIAMEKGQLVKDTDVASLAHYLVTEFRTALMLAASGHSHRDIERHLKVALQVLV
jgi:hypothetical protein